MKRIQLLVVMVVLCAATVLATGANFNDPCYYEQHLNVYVEMENGTLLPVEQMDDFTVQNTCEPTQTAITWASVNTSVLGNVTDGDVILGETWAYVNTVLRPDLDVPALITFKNIPQVMLPKVLRDGVECGDCNTTYDPVTRDLDVYVTGFSNYSLTGMQQFTLQSDYEPELKAKNYQTIDLGTAHRAEEFACIVQIYGRNKANQFILVQTNPKRQVQARILGNPDTNQPESLGYFPTKNGIANVYFTNDNLYGYSDFEYVAQCVSNSTSLVYEESISTRYSPLGRPVVSRGVWLTDGSNAFYLSVYAVFGFFAIIFALMIWRSIKSRL